MQHLDASAAYLRTIDITKRFGPFVALDKISLEIKEGEFLALLGPSGSGKSTFLNILAGFETPSKGQIQHQGRDLVPLPPEARNFGMVFQGYALFPHLTVSQNIAFPLRVRRMQAAEQKRQVAEIIDRVGLRQHADKYPRQLSGGQQQRVALARALVFSPSILLLDEPFSALDKNLREQLQIEVARIHREFGKTFVFVTHDQSEALSMADRVAIFETGELRQVGSPRDVYAKPSSEFVASFLGRINLFPLADTRSEEGWVRGNFGPSVLRARGDVDGPVQIAVRPEHATLSRRAVGGEANEVPVVVRNAAFHGPTVTLGLTPQLGEPSDLTITMLAAEWSGALASSELTLWLSWPAEASLLIPSGARS